MSSLLWAIVECFYFPKLYLTSVYLGSPNVFKKSLASSTSLEKNKPTLSI